ncbi:OPT family oligopeptide transporter [Haloimpatiens massiliensis]|uniref:OPT family oligopeptide transporter n=1 Tax=Haloimpatiens massiliensis TaxID=1658110 RepID=UPI000C81703E|nr:oligopeptide transporter, OPT family [Haloimpatiens massiliensis]
MEQKRKLSHTAYGGIKGEDYVPFVPTSEAMPETTLVSIAIGCIFAIVFAAANVYLGLQVGLTIAAGIPASILGAGMLKIVFKRNNILEANMIQSIASMGESIAGGIIFTLPAIIMWGMKLSLTTIVVCTSIGGLLGILFVVPFRKYLIVEQHGELVFPEGMAASEVLVTGMEGGSGFKTVMTGLLGGGVFKFLSSGLALWKEAPEWTIAPMQNTIFGFNAMASIAGVGYIVGIEVALYMFGGALVAWFGLIPLIKYVGAGLAAPLFPSTELIANMDAWAIWSKYIRYIGAGAVAAGGFISLGRSLPTIIKSFKTAMAGVGGAQDENKNVKRTDIDTPMSWVLGGAVLVFLLCWLLPMLRLGIIGSILVVLFSFFFAVVSARMAGIIGVSNNPVSGMTIATLLFVTAVLKATGYTGNAGMLVAITAGAIVCIGIAVAGGAAQSLKTTYIIGGTPKRVEWGMYAGVVIASAAAGGVLLMLNATYGMGTKAIPAPQAMLMSMVVKGVMTAQLPWALVFVGAIIGIFCALAGLPILPVALGLYLPIHLSAAVLFGGIIRTLVDKKFENNEAQGKIQTERGILLSSGLVAGDALTGIVIAVLTAIKIGGTTIASKIMVGPKIMPAVAESSWTALVAFLILGLWIYKFSSKVEEVAK